MVRALVRAIGVFGRYVSIAEKYDDTGVPEGPTEWDVERGHSAIEEFLKREGKAVVMPRINPLPHLEEGIITGPNIGSIYSFNECLVAHLFASGNGFDFDGIIDTLIALGIEESGINQTLGLLEETAGYQLRGYWRPNPNFNKEVDIPENLLRNPLLLRNYPLLLAPSSRTST